MDLTREQIVDALNRLPRFGRPEFEQTIVITETLAMAIIDAISKPAIRTKRHRSSHVYGADPQ